MRLRPEQLSRQLQDQLLPVYLVTGDEPLLVQEACDAIRARCRESGCDEREVMQVDSKFNWDQLLSSSAEMSLFAERKLIELRIPSGKPGAPGSKAFIAYLQNPGENILLVVAGKIDKASTNSKWFKALDQAGAVIQIWPIDARELPRWLQQRIKQAGLQIDNDALQLLCERVEGNLLAAVQEVEKLRLLCHGDRITAENVSDSVADNARYNLFALVDCALQGDTAGAMKMLHGLRAEGTESAVVLWALSREIRLLNQCRIDIDRGKAQQQVLQAQRIWDKRKPLVSAGLARHSREELAELLHRSSLVDHSIKGLSGGNPWDLLSQLVMDLSRGLAVEALQQKRL
jgi:DNA polymerase-3 subunit delta